MPQGWAEAVLFVVMRVSLPSGRQKEPFFGKDLASEPRSPFLGPCQQTPLLLWNTEDTEVHR